MRADPRAPSATRRAALQARSASARGPCNIGDQVDPVDWLHSLAYPAPELIWGLLSRGIALVYLVSFASLARQVLPVAGRQGVTPIRDSLAAIERDFSTWQRFAYFPSLLWLHRGDAALRGLPWVGMLAATWAIVGGPFAAWAFAVCYLAYLSLDRPMGLVYPWDCVLFEAGFFAMFLPQTLPLPELAAASAPLPAVAWVYRLLVFRVMLGFGKHKFIGSTPQDAGFLKSFLVQQPLPTPLGWHAQKLPLPLLKAGLWGTFAIEICLPFAVFFPGWPSALAGLATIALMIGIQLTGNFGYFNLVMIVLGLSWFDSRTASQFSLSDLVAPQGPVLVHAIVLLHFALAALSFPFNTFCAHTWMNWSPWTRLPRWLRAPAALARALHPLRLAHAYGVFPPQSPPAMRLAPAIEVSWDGAQWHTLTHAYSPVLETCKPRFCAPHHERFDQSVVYEALGLNEASIYRNIVGRWDPYGHGGVPGALLLLRRIVEGTLPGEGFFDRTLLRERGRPKLARVRLYMLEPTSQEERAQTGRYWNRTLVGPHFAPITRDDGFWDQPLPAPEQWHLDDVIWLKRSRLGALMRRAQRGEDPHALVAADPGERTHELTREHVERFWNDFLPAVMPGCRSDWVGLRALVQRVRAHYGRAELHRFERIAGRYAALLFAKLEPLFLDRGILPIFGSAKPTLDAKTNYHLRLLAYHIVSEGKAAYDAVIAEPARASEHLARMTLCSGNYLLALFRYEAFVYQSQKARLLAAYTEHEGRPAPTHKQAQNKARIDAIVRRVWGAMDMIDFSKARFAADDDVLDTPERWPRFAVDEHAEVVRLPPHARGDEPPARACVHSSDNPSPP